MSSPSGVRGMTHQAIHDIISQSNIDDFDWKAYEGTYKGRALITRLLHIPNLLIPSTSTQPTPPSPQILKLSLTALRRLIPLLKQTWDHTLYLQIIYHIKLVAQPDDAGMEVDGAVRGKEEDGWADLEWIEDVKDLERKEAGRLDVELRGYMSNLIKESIRLTYLAFCALARKCGSPQTAIKNYQSARDFSTSAQHHLELGLGLLDTCLSFNLPQQIPSQIQKIEASLDRLHPASTGPSTVPTSATLTAMDIREAREKEVRSSGTRRVVGVKMRVARGVVGLMNGEYERSGREFGEVGEEGGLGDWEGEVISSSDIALITAICTLATSSRERIRRVLLDRTSFRSSVDDTQGWVIDLVRAFMEAKYGEVSTILVKAQPTILLNPFLCAHTVVLITQIRTRCIVQYVQPFSSVKLDTMAGAFGLGLGEMLGEVERLIAEGKIQGRIDLIDHVLSMKDPAIRDEVYTKTLELGKETASLTRVALMRMLLQEAGIVVDPRPRNGGNAGDVEIENGPDGDIIVVGA